MRRLWAWLKNRYGQKPKPFFHGDDEEVCSEDHP